MWTTGRELSTLVMSLLLKQPRVLSRRLELTNISLSVSSPPYSLSSKRDQGTRCPMRLHELSPVRMRSLGQKGHVVTQKRKVISQMERPLNASSMNRICAEASCSSPVITPRNPNTGHLVDVSCQKLLRLDWGRPLGSQPLPRSLTLLLVPPRARWWDLNTIDIVLWLQDIASRQTDIVEGRAGGDPRQGRR
ncbi:hypothetical protein AAFF_G00350240 [Aldrovandia affinis]|uniref:Uncharacterized protein n=1 Tax=Aldrovandia affinis TaxID=143900 RepID=A0AAD7R5F8_9TELE|nr:hypothetical protein AAFF_G00350240 [Aldrovandia affinis]